MAGQMTVLAPLKGKSGGAQPKAGRKPLSRPLRLFDVVAAEMRKGKLPIQCFLEAMRAALDETQQAVDVFGRPIVDADGNPVMMVVPNYEKALPYAIAAAPYCHPKLQAVTVNDISAQQDGTMERQVAATRILAVAKIIADDV